MHTKEKKNYWTRIYLKFNFPPIYGKFCLIPFLSFFPPSSLSLPSFLPPCLLAFLPSCLFRHQLKEEMLAFDFKAWIEYCQPLKIALEKPHITAELLIEQGEVHHLLAAQRKVGSCLDTHLPHLQKLRGSAFSIFESDQRAEMSNRQQLPPFFPTFKRSQTHFLNEKNKKYDFLKNLQE